MASFNFDINEVQSERFVTKPGYYNAMITETTLKAPNAKGTQQLQLVWKTDANEIIRTSYTVICPTSVEAEQIGKRFLRNVCEAIGIMGFRDTNEMCHKQHVILVKEDEPRVMPDGTTKVYLKVVAAYPVGDARIVGSVTPTAKGAFSSIDCMPDVFKEDTEPSDAVPCDAAPTNATLPPWQRR